MPPDASAKSVQPQQVHFSLNAEDGMTYGLTIVPPWKDGGTLHVNFPEHFEHDAVGHGILRYSDKRKNPWIIAADGRSASYDVESLELPGVRISAAAEGLGDRALLRLRIVNRANVPLENIKPLLCFWYSKLAGFPAKLSNNFDHTYVPLEGRLRSLNSIETLNPLATAKVAYVRGCSQHDCDKFARSRGGLIEKDVDRALIAVSDQSGSRKLVIRFTPGKSLLSNAVIPCVHADPYLPRLAPGESAEASGVVLFTEASLEDIGGVLK